MTPLILRELTASDEAAFMTGVSDWDAEDLTWHTFTWKPGMPFSEMLEILRKEKLGIDLAPGRVPHTMLYGFLGNTIVGRLSVRHRLNEMLLRRGGHIGYAVASQYRKRGYATEMVRQGLEYCRNLGLSEILITCGELNLASIRIIERISGRLENKVWDEVDQETIHRYWVKI